MTDVIHFPTSPTVLARKADADQTELLDRIADSHALMVRASKLFADDAINRSPITRELLGRANDWLRMFEQTVDMMELEKTDAA